MNLLLSLPPETMALCAIIIVACIYMHYAAFNARTAILAPSLFTTIGIFATFIGIALGLLHFNAKDIQASVPNLLDGLRTAFWASVFGVGAALTVKLRVAIWGIPVKKGEKVHPHGATIDDLATHLIAVQQALVGSDDSTLITQLKLGRQESNDRIDSLRRVLDEFTRGMAENNSKALIEALEQVMRDFNTKINEQFGENFKQLNSAVAAILVWQERYREQMGEMIGQQERNTKSLEQASLRFESLVTNAERYTQTAHDLANLLQSIETQRASLQGSMTALGQLFVAASKSLPDLETRIVDFADQITRSTKQANDAMVRATQDSANAQRAALLEAQKSLNDGVRAANDGLNNQVQEMISKTKEQVATLDIALQEELTNSLNTLGRQLTGLSQQFVSDYRPLTERLRELVAVASRV